MTDKMFGDMMYNHIVNLWYDQVAPLAVTLLVIGAFLVWIHRRVSTSPLFGRLAELLIANGVVLLLFFRDKFPNPIILLLEMVLAMAAVAYFTAILTNFLLIRLPDWGLEEKYFFEPEEHAIKPYVVPSIVFIEIVLLWFLYPPFFRLEAHLLGDLLPWVMLVLVMAGVSLSVFRLLPYRRVREVALLGETAPPMELDNIFVINGPAPKMELIVVPMLVMAFWAVVYFFSTPDKRAGTDWTGLLLLIAIGASIARIEYLRMKRRERLEAASRPSNVVSLPLEVP